MSEKKSELRVWYRKKQSFGARNQSKPNKMKKGTDKPKVIKPKNVGIRFDTNKQNNSNLFAENPDRRKTQSKKLRERTNEFSEKGAKVEERE